VWYGGGYRKVGGHSKGGRRFRLIQRKNAEEAISGLENQGSISARRPQEKEQNQRENIARRNRKTGSEKKDGTVAFSRHLMDGGGVECPQGGENFPSVGSCRLGNWSKL